MMIRSEKGHLQTAAITHAGMRGKNNEDRYGIRAFRMSRSDATPVLLLIVADGVGGHRAGEVASELAVNTISDVLERGDMRQPVALLNQAFQDANQVIFVQGEGLSEQRGMSTTCASALILGDRLYTAAVGDSRIYLLRGEQILQLSTDHTWVQEAMEQGLISAAEAQSHPNAHVIRRHLGSAQPVQPDFRLRLTPGETDSEAVANQGLQLLPGDQLLLCSDGLTDLVSAAEIQREMSTNSQEVGLKRLVDLANLRGGHDNITIVAAQVPVKRAAGFLRPFLTCLGLLLLVPLLVGLAWVGYISWQGLERGGAPASTASSTLQMATATAGGLPTGGVVIASPQVNTPTPTRLVLTSQPTQTPPGEAGTPAGPTPTFTAWPTNTPSP